jgi:hypothetical protein
MAKCALCKKKISMWSSSTDDDKYYCEKCWDKHMKAKEEKLKKSEIAMNRREKVEKMKSKTSFSWKGLGGAVTNKGNGVGTEKWVSRSPKRIKSMIWTSTLVGIFIGFILGGVAGAIGMGLVTYFFTKYHYKNRKQN